MADSSKPEKPLHALLSHSLVDIYVGSENTHWILHEKLLCARSKFFQKVFYAKDSHTSSFGLPDDEDEPFAAFVSWLYSGKVNTAKEEKDLGVLFDLYLMGEKWQAPSLVRESLKEVRNWYASTDTYPGLRRVQYIYANTDEQSEMRKLLVHSVARMMALSENIPLHWDKALRKNGQLAVDLIKSIQAWHIDAAKVPDARSAPNPDVNDDVKMVEETAVGGKDAGDEKAELPKTNGVDGRDAEEAPEQVKKGLDDNLPNGLPNGISDEEVD